MPATLASRSLSTLHRPARWISLLALSSALGATLCASTWAAPVPAAPAASQPAAPASSPLQGQAPRVENSVMDGPLFYQLLVAEVQATQGQPGTAYQLYLEAAKRLHNGQLYQRAVEIALKGRAGEQALAAAKAWRKDLPHSREAADYTTQILLALRRTTELAPTLRALIQLTPAPQQPQLIASLPRSLNRLADQRAAARVIDEATQPWRQPPLEMAEAWAASAEGWLRARDVDKTLAGTRRALALKPELPVAGLLAIDLMGLTPEADPLVKGVLARPDTPHLVRLGYARKLVGLQRLPEAATELESLVKAEPDNAGPWLLLGAVRLELGQADQAEVALQRVLQISEQHRGDGASVLSSTSLLGPVPDIEQTYLLLAQVSQLKKKPQEALNWLDKADPRREKLGVQLQRARLIAASGKLSQARGLIKGLPEGEPRDAVLKIQAETQLLREARQWEEAYRVLNEGVARFPDEVDLAYDLAMLAERLHRYDDMERLLRQVLEQSPDHANAYNALGYSLADRGVRLPEAAALLQKAIALKPNDAFITDSLGWLAFREGRVEEARRLLTEAYAARPDAEIAAHLGEVLWTLGQTDEARRIWREGQQRDADNDTLRETLKRFKVQP